MHVQVIVDGPVFDGRMRRAITGALGEITEIAAQDGYDMVQTRLASVLKHPTGHYQSRIKRERVSDAQYRIHDDMVIYGPWLEGVGSRNHPVTKFRGYHTFRRVTTDLNKRLPVTAARVIADRIARL